MRGFAGAAIPFVVLLLGSASASWIAMGQEEPSTAFDAGHGSMFPDADTDGDLAPGVYFQAFQAVGELSLNPNAGTTGSRVLPAGAVHHRAVLGLWKDCNRDGYLGLAESAVLDYSSALLPDARVCPAGSLFNRDGWVSESIGIGMVDPCERMSAEYRARECPGVAEFHENDRVYYAPGTMVWADAGAPGAVPPGECSLTPPRGTTSGGGLLLAYVDCQAGGRVDAALAPHDPEGLRNSPFPLTLFGGPQGPGILEAGTGAPAARAWDCDAQRSVEAQDPTGLLGTLSVQDPSGTRLSGPQAPLPVLGRVTLFDDHDDDATTPGVRRIVLADERGVLLHAPAPAPGVDASGSAWDALEHAADGPQSDCDGRTALRDAAPGPIAESGAPTATEARKDRTSLAFTFYDGHRGLNEDWDHLLLGPAAPSDGGLVLFRHGRGGVGPLWSADAPSANEPHLVTRGSLQASEPVVWTYYAKLGDVALDAGFRLAGGARTYGVEACGVSFSGERNGWVCDPALWWKDALGGDARPRYAEGAPYAPLPGETYHLRDVDCYDGHVALGLYAGGGALTDGCTL